MFFKSLRGSFHTRLILSPHLVDPIPLVDTGAKSSPVRRRVTTAQVGHKGVNPFTHAAEARAAEVHTAQAHAAEVHAAEARAGKVHTAQARAVKVHTAKACAAKALAANSEECSDKKEAADEEEGPRVSDKGCASPFYDKCPLSNSPPAQGRIFH